MSVCTTLSRLCALLLLAAHRAAAAPHASTLRRRDDGGSNVVRIVVPIVVVVSLVALALGIRFRRPIAAAFRGLYNDAAFTPPTTAAGAGNGTGVRELTAAEMTGAPAAPATGAAAAATRRPRRNRRTPSQISTKSLPVYAKEAGDHELVIIQGSQDLEDNPAAGTTVIMPAVQESESDDSHGAGGAAPARAHSRHSSYVHVDSGAHAGTPLLAEHGLDNENENAITNTATNNAPTTPAHAGDESSAHLLAPSPGASPIVDPRGEAPPYFQVHDSPDGLQRVDTRDTLPLAPVTSRDSDAVPASPPAPAPAAGADTTRRRSVFRGIMQAFNPRARHEPEPRGADAEGHPPPPPIPESAPRASTSRLSVRPAGASHRPSQSAGSAFSLASSGFHRTTSRISNAGPLTSPSLISVNSISSPLTHTAVRTDIVYPRTGPTPEQIKYISSREAVAKFGVPFGADAVAFHASSSRVNLAEPTPDYEERPSLDGRRSADSRGSFDGLPARESPTRLRPRSNLSSAALTSPADLSGSSSAPSMSPDTSLDAGALSPDTSLGSEPDDFSPAMPHVRDSTMNSRKTAGRASVVTVKASHRPEGTDGTITRASTITGRAPAVEIEPSTPLSPAPGSGLPSPTASAAPAPTVTAKHTPPPIAVPPPAPALAAFTGADAAPAFGPRKSAPAGTGAGAAPPTAFRATMPERRPASRADSVGSVATFATAREIPPTPSEFGAFETETETEDEEMVSAPGTPRAGAAALAAA